MYLFQTEHRINLTPSIRHSLSHIPLVHSVTFSCERIPLTTRCCCCCCCCGVGGGGGADSGRGSSGRDGSVGLRAAVPFLAEAHTVSLLCSLTLLPRSHQSRWATGLRSVIPGTPTAPTSRGNDLLVLTHYHSMLRALSISVSRRAAKRSCPCCRCMIAHKGKENRNIHTPYMLYTSAVMLQFWNQTQSMENIQYMSLCFQESSYIAV